MSDSLTNLDSKCAEYGYNIVHDCAPNDSISKSDKSKLENTITKSLGVLQENGVYAFYLYLDYRSKEIGSKEIKDQTLTLLGPKEIYLLGEECNDHFKKICKLTEDIDKLLFARQMLDQTLIYARYHAKALAETKDKKAGETE